MSAKTARWLPAAHSRPPTSTPVKSFVPQTNVAGVYGTFSLLADGTWSYTLDNASPLVQALPAGATPTDTFAVASLDGTASSVTITIHGANDPAVITGDTTGDVSEDGTLVASGALMAADVDAGQESFVPQTNVAGVYGTFSLLADGTWSYTLDNASPLVQALPAGATPTDTFAVASLDGTASSVTITIHGANDPAVITGDTTGDVSEDGTLVASGASRPPTSTPVKRASCRRPMWPACTARSHCWLTAPGATRSTTPVRWSKPCRLASPTDTFAVASLDGTASSVTITIHGANDPALITGDTTGDVSEDGTLVASGASRPPTSTPAKRASCRRPMWPACTARSHCWPMALGATRSTTPARWCKPCRLGRARPTRSRWPRSTARRPRHHHIHGANDPAVITGDTDRRCQRRRHARCQRRITAADSTPAKRASCRRPMWPARTARSHCWPTAPGATRSTTPARWSKPCRLGNPDRHFAVASLDGTASV